MKSRKKLLLLLGTLLIFSIALNAATAVRAMDCTTTYENFGKAFMEKYCLRCHDSAKKGIARNGAPGGVNFNDPKSISGEKAGIIKYAANKKSMPPSDPKPSDDERAKLKEWLDCEYK